jgi:hypothetical protein
VDIKLTDLAVTAMGKPSGIKATATLTQSTMRRDTEIQLGCSFRSHAAQTIITNKTIVSIIATMTLILSVKVPCVML